MFKFDKKSLKKFTVVSASALMLLSVGGGAVNAMHSPAHAELISLHDLGTKRDKDMMADRANEEKAALDAYKKHPSLERHDKQYDPAEYQSIIRGAHRYLPNKTADHYLSQIHNNNVEGKAVKPSRKFVKKDHARKSQAKPVRHVAKKHVYRHHKATVLKHKEHRARVIKRRVAKKVIRKRHARHAKRASLKEQIVQLKRELHRLQHQIKVSSKRKYRGRRAKRNAKRHLVKLNRQYLNVQDQLKKLTAKPVRKHHAKKHLRKHVKRSNRKNKRYTHHTNKRALKHHRK